MTDDDGLTLVDTTMRSGVGRIENAIAAVGGPLRRIVLTHAHDDHAGGLDALAARHPDAEVVVSKRDARLLRGDLTVDPCEPQTRLRGDLHGAATVPTRTVALGELVGALRVVGAPGHTPGHVAYLDERDGTLFCGDAYATLFAVATCARPSRRFPLPGFATWHRPTAAASAEALCRLAPTRLAPGHGPVVDDPAHAMRRAVERTSRRRAKRGS